MSELHDTQVQQGEDSQDSHDDPEYVQRMVDRAEGQRPPQDDSGDSGDQDTGADTGGEEGAEDLPRDENGLILGKYKTPGDLAKAYKELESKLGSQGNDSGDDNSGTGDGVELERDTSGDDEGEGQGDESGEDDSQTFDFQKYTEEFVEKGELSDDSLSELESKGISRDMVEYYVAGIRAENEKRTNAAVEAVGGEERFEQVRKWASNNLDEKEFEAYNKQLQNAQSAEEISAIYSTLNTRFQKATGQESKFVSGDTGAPGKSGYNSKQEMIKDMQDDRYQTDPAFRKEVEQRIANSNIL